MQLHESNANALIRITSANVLRCGIHTGSSRCVANSSSAAVLSTYDAPPLLNTSSAGPGNCYIIIRYIIIRYIIVRYILLRYIILRYIILHYILLRYIILRYILLQQHSIYMYVHIVLVVR
jgi:hypothetical protein